MSEYFEFDFGSLDELSRHVEALPFGEEDPYWNAMCGGITCRQAQDLAVLGWPKGIDQAREALAEISERVVSEPSETSHCDEYAFDVTGAAFDPGAYLSGVPECWGVIAPQKRRRAVHLVVNSSVSSSVKPEAVMQRGIAATALAMSFESRGHPVTVDLVARSNYTARVRLAGGDGSPLDLDRLIFAIAHPAMQRHLIRAVVDGERSTRLGRFGPGTPTDVAEEFQGDIYLKRMRGSDPDMDDPFKWVIKQLEAQTAAEA